MHALKCDVTTYTLRLGVRSCDTIFSFHDYVTKDTSVPETTPKQKKAHHNVRRAPSYGYTDSEIRTSRNCVLGDREEKGLTIPQESKGDVFHGLGGVASLEYNKELTKRHVGCTINKKSPCYLHWNIRLRKHRRQRTSLREQSGSTYREIDNNQS